MILDKQEKIKDYNLSKLPKSDVEMVTKLDFLFDSAKSLKSVKNDIFETAYRFMKGEQWENQKPEYLADMVINIMKSTKNTKKATILDNRPKFNIMPVLRKVPYVLQFEGQEFTVDEKFLMNLRTLIEDYGYKHWGIEVTIEDIIDDTLTYGTGIMKVTYDPKAMFGRGDVVVERVSPDELYVSMYAKSDAQKVHYIAESRVVLLDDLQTRYKKAKYVVAEPDISVRLKKKYDDYTNSSASVSIQGGLSADEMMDTKASKEEYASIELVELKEMWLMDFETERVEEPILNPSTNEVMRDVNNELMFSKEDILKYPKGRHLVWANGVLLVDEPNPYIDGKFPYAIVHAERVPDEFWGEGEYEQNHGMQRAMNRIMCNLIDWSNGAHNKHIVKRGALQDNNKIVDKPWQILELDNPSQDYRQEVAPPPPSGMFELLTVIRGLYDTISGTHDSTRGAKTPGLDKVGIAQQLAAADFTRMKLTVKSMERALSQVGEMCISRVMQYEDKYKLYSFMGQDGKPMSLEFDGFPSWIDLALKVDVKSDSTLPKDKSSLAALSLQLFDKGIIGQRYLLDVLELPDAEAAIAETDKLKQLEQALQQAEQQMQEMAKQMEGMQSENQKLGNKLQTEQKARTQEKVTSGLRTLRAEALSKISQAQKGVGPNEQGSRGRSSQ